MKPVALASVVAVVAGVSGFAANRQFSVEQVMSAPFSSQLVASPDGAKVAWLINEEGRRNLWVAASPDWKARKVTNFTQDDGEDIGDVSWAPDGTYVLFTRGGDLETGGPNPDPELNPTKPEQSVWIVAMDGSAAKRLTEGHLATVSPKGDQIAFLRAGQIWIMSPAGQNVTKVVEQNGDQQDLQWSPDGSQLAFVSARKDHSFIGLYAPAEKTLRYLDPSSDEDAEPVWSPDSHHIAHVRRATQGHEFYFEAHRAGPPWSIRVIDVQTGDAREVFRADPGPGSLFHGIEAQHQIFWGAGDHIVFPWERTGWCHLYSVSLTGGAPSELTPGEGVVEHVAIAKNRKTMFYSSNIGELDSRHLWQVGVDGESKPQKLTSGDVIAWSPAPLADNSSLAYLASSFNESAHAVVRHGAQTTSLAPETVPAQFPAASLIKPQAVLMTASDGLQIHGQLFLPAEPAGERHPALIFFHGGSRRQMLLGFHYMDYYSNAYALNQYFANHGYVVLSVNYRSGIGYGLNFREAINYGPRGGSEFNDVMGAALYLKSRPEVDPKRIGVWGGSYGGYLTAMALSRASDLFAAGVDFHGVHDWSTLDGIFTDQTKVGGDPKAVEAQKEAARIAFESSPMASVDTWKSPVLLIHGDDDRNVDFSQTVILVEALRKHHVEFDELIIPNEIHGFLRHQSWLKAYNATQEYFGNKLGSAPRP
jgi:dipeptidyl aminopeptidase/acylaminoacyl peptidase